MEAVLGQVEQLPALLAVSRSALVRDWDSLTLDRALEWARYFQHLHERFRARPQLREALARRLRRSQPCPLLGFPALGRCPQLLGLALLENRALPPAACRRLLRSLLQPPGAGPGSDPRGLPLLARRKAAARLLAVPRRAPGPEPQLQAEARLLLSRLQQEGQRAGEAAGQLRWMSGIQEGQRAGEAAGQLRWLSGVQEEQRVGEAAGQLRWMSGVQEGQRAGEAAGQLRWLSGVQEGQQAGETAGQLRWLSGALELLPQPRAFGVVAAALALLKQGPGAEQAGDGDRDGSSSPDGYQESAAGDGCTAGLLLSWLLGNQDRFSAFCLCLPSSHLAFLAGHYSQLSRFYLDLLTSWGRHLHYDPLQGRWVKSCLDKAELSWEELRERFICLCQGSTQLKEQTQAALELLRTQDGDFKVRGLSVWADLLMEVGY